MHPQVISSFPLSFFVLADIRVPFCWREWIERRAGNEERGVPHYLRKSYAARAEMPPAF